MSDRTDQPFRWIFPNRTLPAGGFLVVFASGKDRTAGSALHSNFSMNGEGEALVLTAPDGSTLDAVPGVSLRKDISHARAADGDGAWRFFTAPTPGAANTGASFAELLALAPAFSTEGGFHAGPISLTLVATEPGTLASYTLDGSEPTDASPVFGSPLDVRSRSGEANVLSMIGGTSTANQHTDGWRAPVG